MARFVLAGGFVEIDGVNLTDHVSSVAVNMVAEELDVTTYADENHRRAQGLADDAFELTVQSDFDAGSVDEVLYPHAAVGSDFLVRVRSSAAPVSPTNPEYSGMCMLLEYSPMAGTVGDLSSATVTLSLQGARITRTTVATS